MRDKLRREFAVMYCNADVAYGALDFSGLGYITQDAFLNSIVVREKTKFSLEQI